MVVFILLYDELYDIYRTYCLYLPIKDVIQAENLTRVLFENYLNTCHNVQ